MVFFVGRDDVEARDRADQGALVGPSPLRVANRPAPCFEQKKDTDLIRLTLYQLAFTIARAITINEKVYNDDKARPAMQGLGGGGIGSTQVRRSRRENETHSRDNRQER